MDSARSPRLLRRINFGVVLGYALGAGEFTAARAMEATSLTRATVLGLCTEMVEAGWLEECGATTRIGPGRPAHRYRIAGRLRVAGIDAGEHHFSVRVADLHGEQVAGGREEVDSWALGREGRVRVAREFLETSMAEAGCRQEDLLLTVVGIPAPVDAEGRSPEGQHGFWPLMNAGFAAGLPGRVVIENDANLAALAESGRAGDGSDGAARGSGNSATLLTGERFGSGLIVDGRLLRGARGGAGEMRLLDAFFDDPEGTSGIAALARSWAREVLEDPALETSLRRPPGTGVPDSLDSRDGHAAVTVTVADVAAAVSAGDAAASRIVDRISWRIARIALALASLLDVDTVILAGAPADLIDAVLVRARRILETEFYPPLPCLVAGRLGVHGVVHGAVEHALALLREDPLQYLS
ncbi:ROK family transcriptional regulator [Acidipropionibacterium virtanenii]|uniref:N-acetylglucosamine repressor n=1 Tax=Acidipropionibacterium virtanenii TaxID=2057246 RepID=A0A344UQH7_9ACTN|nr:ROK family protein [Acidipropionibacterium virtanenii]AXE37525.1 hypothetical protein JS278_00328 [Acidipropionibacterium virtanenii]